ncbi:DUF5947 family protein [Nocardia sp. NPDC001965]
MSTPFGALRRIAAEAAPAAAAAPGCDMCAEPIGEPHQHVVDIGARQLMCVCRACYLLFTDRQAALRYRAVPDRYLAFPDLTIERAEWEALEIPVGLAFFLRNSAQDRTFAFYPGPAGATESELPLTGWRALLEHHPELGELADDVEALLIRMPEHESSGGECLVLPIDVCYEFVGRMRILWRGFDGGRDARRYLDEFFVSMRAHARAGGGR